MRPPNTFLLAASLALLPAGARANLAAPLTRPSELSSPATTRSELAVDDEDLVLRCEERSGEPVCRVEARYRVVNPTAEAILGLGAFYGVRMRDVRITAAGARADAPLDAVSIARLDELVAPAHTNSGRSLLPPELERFGFRLNAAPRSQIDLTAAGWMHPERTRYSSYSTSAARGRHPVFHAGEPRARVYHFTYLIAPIRSWSGAHRIRLNVSAPPSWRAELSTRASGPVASLSVLTSAVANEWTASLAGDRVQALELTVELPGSAEHGGPFLALGTVTGDHAASGFRIRFGWEAAWPPELVHALTVDLGSTPEGFGNRVLVTPQIEVASPHLLILPSLSAGIGVPVELEPKLRAGVRLLGGLQLYALGFVLSFDVFPGREPADGMRQLALLGRLSF
jgi:hypothetical protein